MTREPVHRLIALAAAITLAAGLGAPAADDKPAAKKLDPATIAVVGVGKVDKDLQAAVIKWLRANMGPVRDAGTIAGKDKNTPEKVLDRVNDVRKPGDVVVLALRQAPARKEFGDALLVTNRIAVLDLGGMQFPEGDKPVSPEMYRARAEAESVRGVALALGIEPCPFFRCALLPADTPYDFDHKSKNLCPPCQEKMEGARVREGMPAVLVEE